MTQQDSNQQEWENPTNWSGPRWMGIYFSKRDTRTWVPKSKPILGWTLNFGQPMAVIWAALFMTVITLLAFGAGFFVSG